MQTMTTAIEIPRVGSLLWEGDRASFAKAFVAAQAAMDAVKKASTNPAFRSKYADLAGVVEAVVPALNAHGIAVVQAPAFDGEHVSVTTTFLHESGSAVTSVLDLRPIKADPQGVGSATTYARRYALMAMTGAAPEDDDGNAASKPRSTAVVAMSKTQARDDYEGLQTTLRACKSEDALNEWAGAHSELIARMPPDWAKGLRDEWKAERDGHRAAGNSATTPFDEAA
jgi:hypothetical protein